MKKTITWKQEEAPEDEKERTILIVNSTTEIETKEEVTTIAQKENELINANQQVVDAQKKVDELTAEIAEIKLALGIKI